MYSSSISLTSALDGSGWLTTCTCRFHPGNENRYPLYRRLGGSVWTGAKNIVTLGFDPRTFQRVVSLYGHMLIRFSVLQITHTVTRWNLAHLMRYVLCNLVLTTAPVRRLRHPCDGSNFWPVSVLSYATFRDHHLRKGLNSFAKKQTIPVETQHNILDSTEFVSPVFILRATITSELRIQTSESDCRSQNPLMLQPKWWYSEKQTQINARAPKPYKNVVTNPLTIFHGNSWGPFRCGGYVYHIVWNFYAHLRT
jgi:hypothetical protein